MQEVRRICFILCDISLRSTRNQFQTRFRAIILRFPIRIPLGEIPRNCGTVRNCSCIARNCAKLRGIEQKLQGSKLRASKIPCVGNPKLTSVIHWCINCRITFSNCTEITTAFWKEKTNFALLYKSINYTNKWKE